MGRFRSTKGSYSSLGEVTVAPVVPLRVSIPDDIVLEIARHISLRRDVLGLALAVSPHDA